MGTFISDTISAEATVLLNKKYRGNYSISFTETSDKNCISIPQTFLLKNDIIDGNIVRVTNEYDKDYIFAVHYRLNSPFRDSIPFELTLNNNPIVNINYRFPAVISDSSLYNFNKNLYQIQLQYTGLCGNPFKSSPHYNILLNAILDIDYGKITLNWNSYRPWPKNETIYQLWQSKNNRGFELIEETTDTSWTATPWTEAKFQQYKIVAKNIANSLESHSNTIRAYFLDNLVIHNGLTSNGDDRNKYFRIDRIGLFPNNTLQIYDAFGNKVYEASPYRNDWDATRNGKYLPEGTYMYTIDKGNGQKPLSVTLHIFH